MLNLLSAADLGGKELCILMDFECSVRVILRCQQLQLALPSLARKLALFVAGFNTLFFRQQPYLQKADWLASRCVVFTMRYASAGAHALHLTRTDNRTCAHAVLVLQRALQHVGDDLHVVVRVSPKAAPALYPVFVDNTQAAEAHIRGIVVPRKRECMECI